MSNSLTYGVLKFFRDKEKLDFLLDGGFYCNTPEFYRLSDDEGVSDHNESCSHSYRKIRGDQPVKLQINGEQLEGINNLTLHVDGLNDRYLHCWSLVRIPEDEEGLKVLTQNINRMRIEFGKYYAFISGVNLEKLVSRLSNYTDFNIHHGNVNYSNSQMEWSAVCKSDEYSYQQEYRFLVGNCGHTDTQPLIIKCDQSLRDLIGANQLLQISDNESNRILFELSKNECFYRPNNLK